jgi:hypothetical protein
MKGIMFSNFFNDSSWIKNTPFIRYIKNPIYTAILITVLVMIIIFAIYDLKGTGAKLGIRLFIYVSVFVSVILAIHRKAIINNTEEESKSTEIRQLFKSVQISGGGEDINKYLNIDSNYDFHNENDFRNENQPKINEFIQDTLTGIDDVRLKI